MAVLSPIPEVQDSLNSGSEIPPTSEISEPLYSDFSYVEKMWIVSILALASLISPLGSMMYLPALNTLSDSLNITPAMTNVSITTYMFVQAVAPSILGGLSDSSGRRLSFIVCFVIYIVANIGIALQTHYVALLLLRMLQAAGCSATIALSAAVVADITTSAERAKIMGYVNSGIFFGPAFGPTIGGILARYMGWRAIFWFLAIYGSILLAIVGLLFPETCRAVVGDGSIPARGIHWSLFGYFRERRQSAISSEKSNSAGEDPTQKTKRRFNPLRALKLFADKETLIIFFYISLFYTVTMTLSVVIPFLFKRAYHIDELQIGFCYISMGVGGLIASFTSGYLGNWNHQRHARRLNITIEKGKEIDLRDFPIEQSRLEVVLPGHLLAAISLIAFGWAVHFKAHISLPVFILFFSGYGNSAAFNNSNVLLTDLHRDEAATATGAVNLVRCLMSAGACAAMIPLCQAVNPGWAFTLLGLFCFVLTYVLHTLMKNGMRWRAEARAKKEQANTAA